jgi:molybdenum cofactor cytidylyltransferase
MTGPDPSEVPGVVLLAAGGSVRLGQPKQLIRINGEALVRRIAGRLLQLRPASLVVVTGCASDEVRAQLSGLPVQIVHNPKWVEGMGTSIALGVKNMPPEVKGVLIMLCDQWRVDLADLQRLIEAWNCNISDILAVSWIEDNASIYGPPVVFPRTLIHELISLSGDQGAKWIIEKNRGRSEFITMENAAFDLDEPGDLQQLTQLPDSKDID